MQSDSSHREQIGRIGKGRPLTRVALARMLGAVSVLCAALAAPSTVGAQAASASSGAQVPQHRQVQCESALPATRVEVLAEQSQLEVDHPSWNELDRHFQVGKQVRVMGRTTAQPKMETRIGGKALPATEGKVGCFRPNIRVTLSASPQRVSIAKEVPLNSCGYQHVLKHEMEHVRINQSGIQSLANYLQEELTKRYGNQVFYGDVSALQQAFKRDVQGWLPIIQREFTARLARAHAQLDTPQEYARSRTVCDGELARLLDGKPS